MKFVAYITTILLFLGPCVHAYFGWQVEGNPNVSVYYTFYPAYFLLFFSLSVYYIFNVNEIKSIKHELIVTFTTILLFIGLRIFRGTGSVMIIFNSIGLPVLVSALFCTIGDDQVFRIRIRNLLIFLFLIEILIALYERLFIIHIFPLELAYEYAIDDYTDKYLFRSTALFGHPLSNALIVSTIMGFILISDMKAIFKYSLFFGGSISLLCFNARAAMLISGLSFFIYVIHNLLSGETTKKTKLIFIISSIVFIFLIISLFESGWGGRLFESSSISEDDSALARIVVWDILDKLDLSTFLFGMTGDLTEFAEQVIDTVHIENWFIVMIMGIGLIATLFFIYMMFFIFRKNLTNYTRFQKLFVSGIMLIIASTNNSLSSGVQVISIFFVCSYAFKKNAETEEIEEEETEIIETAT